MNKEPVIELKPTSEVFPEHQIGKMTSGQADESEVGGRAIERRLARCGRCGATSWIEYDTVNYRAYQCNNCACTVSFGCG